MTNKALVAFALVVGMIWVGLLSLSATGAPQHVVAGGVYGPGGDVSPTNNPANSVTLTYYSTEQPGYAVLTGASPFIPADGTNQSFFFLDVGATWDWSSGDDVVVVVEAIRGTNGWTGANYTTSLKGDLMPNPTTTDVQNGTLERIPQPTLTAGAGNILVLWAAVSDEQGNVVSYRLYHRPPTGGYTPLATVDQGPSPSFDATGLQTGQHCFTLAVNYKRDTGSAVYETVGRSDPVCATVAGENPRIIATDPANGAANVPLNYPITVTFSEAIQPGSLIPLLMPSSVTLVASWPSTTQVILSHGSEDFTPCTVYTMQITQAHDVDGNNLAPGTVPNPWTFTTFCPSPYITSTVPASGATQVPRSMQIRITFSKAMNQGSLVVSVNSASEFCTWPLADVCALGTSLVAGTTYTVHVSAGTDLQGNPLVGGPVPNPWSFTVNRPPDAVLTAPGTNLCVTGGSTLTISWTMQDVETPVQNLRVWLSYRLNSVVSPIPDIQGQSNFGSPESYDWQDPPMVDGSIEILLEVQDQANEAFLVWGNSVQIDSTAPRITATTPANDATGVATAANIVVTFSEAMNLDATRAAVTITPNVPGLAYAWNGPANTILTISHTTGFATATRYTVSVGSGARDDCTPGLPLTTANRVFNFTTAAAARRPSPPRELARSSVTSNAVTFTWAAPTTYTDGSALAESQIRGYDVYRSTQSNDLNPQFLQTVTAKTFTDGSVSAGTTYYYRLKAVDTADQESDFSAELQVATSAEVAPGVNPLVILIPIIVAALLIAAFLLLRKKKPAAAPPPPSQAARTASAGGQAATPPPPGETTAAGEEGKFIPCPNCGTMVKPTDVECFVCGAKL